MSARNQAQYEDDQRYYRSKGGSDDEEGLERRDALSERDGCNRPGSNEDQQIGTEKLG